jgi:hypothetical protein
MYEIVKSVQTGIKTYKKVFALAGKPESFRHGSAKHPPRIRHG